MAVQQPGAPVLKAFSVLRRLAESSNGISLQDLADDLGLHVSTAHRLLRLLMGEGLASSDARTKMYEVGPDFRRLAALVVQNSSLETTARPFLHELRAACDETVCLAAFLPAQGQLTFLAMEECSHPLRYVIELGVQLPLYTGASGKAILAFLPEAEVDAILVATAAAGDRDADPGWLHLKAELEEVRRRGYALSQGERIPGAVGIAAPIFDAGSRVVGDLVITIPVHRFTPDQPAQLAPLLIEYARRISRLAHFPGR